MINVRFSENEILISTSSFITGVRRKIKIILLYIIVFLSCFFLNLQTVQVKNLWSHKLLFDT